MIRGIGIDLVELVDFKDKTDNEAFIKRILSDKEKEVLNSYKSNKRRLEYLGSRFAAKEAFSKALSNYDGKTNFNEIEVLNYECGKPYITFLRDPSIEGLISLSHTENYAIAKVIIYNKKVPK